MSAALQFPTLARAAADERQWTPASDTGIHPDLAASASTPEIEHCPARPASMAFYRKHTESLLRRYLYASMLVARAPSILNEPIVRGWASSRPVESFEDCVIFVIDMEKCLARLTALERLLITRIVLQEYSFAETALLMNRSERSISSGFAEAIDCLTEILLDTATLILPYRLHRPGYEPLYE
jgi:hypothetical protein